MLLWVYWMIFNIDNASSEQANNEKPQNWRGYSYGLYLLLPVAGLAVLWGRRDFINKLLMQIDKRCLAVFCPSLSTRETLLKWAGSRLPLTWSSQSRTLSGGVVDLWNDGSLLCTLMNTAIPGVCANPHRHWKKPPMHAQAVAYKYFGLTPVFTEKEFCDKFTASQERIFIKYLTDLQKAMIELSSTQTLNQRFSSSYLARGMGLSIGEQDKKATFYVYSNKKTTRISSSLLIYIRGPYQTFGNACLPNDFGLKTIPKIKINNNKMVDFEEINLTNNSNEKNSTSSSIHISIDLEEDRAKVTYVPKNYGMYEILLVANGDLIQGCPYNVSVSPTNESNTDMMEESFPNKSDKTNELNNNKEKILENNLQTYFNVETKNNLIKSNESNHNNLTVYKDPDVKSLKAIFLNNKKGKQSSENHKSDEHCNKKNEQVKSNNTKSNDLVDIVNSILKDKVNKTNSKESFKDNSINNATTNINNEEKYILATDQKLNVKDDYTKHSSIEEEINFKSLRDRFNSEASIDLNNKSNIIKKADIVKENPAPDRFLKCLPNITSKNVYLNSESAPKTEPENINQNNTLATKDKDVCKSKEINMEKNTSPICSNHIEFEVRKVIKTFNDLSTAEKRNSFKSKGNTRITKKTDVTNSSFSDSENAAGSKTPLLKKLSVLNVLNSLLESERRPFPLVSTVSLPNMLLNNIHPHQEEFHKNKMFWERLSLQTVSLDVLSSSSGKIPDQSDSLTHKKEENFKITKDNLSQSQDNLKSLTSQKNDLRLSQENLHRTISNTSLSKKYKSVDSCLDECTTLTIEERKKILLKHRYEQESIIKRSVSQTTLSPYKVCPSRTFVAIESSTVKEKIKLYDKNYGLKRKLCPIKQDNRNNRFWRNFQKHYFLYTTNSL